MKSLVSIGQLCKMYPFEEQIDIIFIYGKCYKNLLQVKIFIRSYLNQTQPLRRVFKNVCDKQ